VCITLTRPGFRIKRRRLRQGKIGRDHRISKEDAITFMKQNFNALFEED